MLKLLMPEALVKKHNCFKNPSFIPAITALVDATAGIILFTTPATQKPTLRLIPSALSKIRSDVTN